jgi:hypothetical protein
LLFERKINTALKEINENEISYLEKKTIPFENGLEFNDFHHPYAYDLISWRTFPFQNLNRTATFIGKKKLAEQLLTLSPNQEIIENQTAVKELSGKLDWRQNFLALAKVSQDSKASYEALLWGKFTSAPLSKVSIVVFM